ncbi:unnamed protein product [Arabis nemorensis]|uniref:Uncharacterized protein n=1 Tax=Arabis nemorensis TaxID=586526 RepID=A0A565B014_9BRAS|nr:unnamed protein product [Arabis nemorensis]
MVLFCSRGFNASSVVFVTFPDRVIFPSRLITGSEPISILVSVSRSPDFCPVVATVGCSGAKTPQVLGALIGVKIRGQLGAVARWISLADLGPSLWLTTARVSSLSVMFSACRAPPPF